MSLKATCSSCGKTFWVPDRLAGKRFRCKNCGDPVQVPELETDDDLFGDMDFGGGESIPDELPLKPKKSSKSKKRGRKSAKGGGGVGRIATIAGATVAGFFVLSVALGVFVRLAPLLASMATPLSWQEYTTPDGRVTVQMPGDVKPAKVAIASPGARTLGVQNRRFACILMIESVPLQVKGIPDEEFINALSEGVRRVPGVIHVEEMQVAGHPGVRFDRLVKGETSEAIGFKSGDSIYTLAFAYRGKPDTGIRDKFFNSVRVNNPIASGP